MGTPQMHHASSWSVKDLGELQAPLLICGGVYGNLEAFQALIALADSLSISTEQIIHTGDIAACCADPVATIELMAGSNINAIQGNVENSLVQDLHDCGCESSTGAICDISARNWYNFLDGAIEEQHRRYIAKLPHQLRFKSEGRSVHVVHGSVSSINQFIFASDPSEVFQKEFEKSNADIIVSGHSGIPFTRRFGRKVWHNSGGLGLPANDGTHRVWYSLAIPDKKYGLHFEHHALEYDFEKARLKMAKHQQLQGYSNALKTGIWPNKDSLPEAERFRTAQPLNRNQLLFEDKSKPGMVSASVHSHTNVSRVAR